MGAIGERKKIVLLLSHQFRLRLNNSAPPPHALPSPGGRTNASSQVCYNLVNFLQRDEQDKQARIDYLKGLAEAEAKEVPYDSIRYKHGIIYFSIMYPYNKSCFHSFFLLFCLVSDEIKPTHRHRSINQSILVSFLLRDT